MGFLTCWDNPGAKRGDKCGTVLSQRAEFMDSARPSVAAGHLEDDQRWTDDPGIKTGKQARTIYKSQ